jgi:hypothetical protein
MNIHAKQLLTAAVLAAGLMATSSVHAHCGACAKGGKPENHDHAKAESTPDAYPLETCVVSGRKLGSMGEPYVHKTDEGTEVRFCCKGCLPAFKKSPDTYLKKIVDASEAEKTMPSEDSEKK